MTLLEIWKQSKEVVEETKLNRDYKKKKAEAGVEMLTLQNLIAEAEEAYDKEKENCGSLMNQPINLLIQRKIKLEEAKKRFQFAVDIYKDCFGEDYK
jgi:hypothetical protein